MRSKWAALLGLLLIISGLRVAVTYPVFSNTYDEMPHIGAAMQYLETGQYTYEAKHPPMRVIYAIGPWLRGARYAESQSMIAEGHHVLYDRGDYFGTLSSARIAALPFFLATVVLVFFWALKLSGPMAGIAGATAYATLPLALGHAALATTDTLVSATMTIALLAWALLLGRPSRDRVILFGVAAGIAVLSKFSALIFGATVLLVTGFGWLLGIRGFGGDPTGDRVKRWKDFVSAGLLMLAVSAIVIWTGYGFSFDGLPAPQFFIGLYELLQHNAGGHPGYFMGNVSDRGHWAFFPVSLFIKTPLPFLFLGAIGASMLLRRGVRRNEVLAVVPPTAALLIMFVSMASSINIGARHLLPMFPLLAICVGEAAAAAWRSRRLLFRSLLMMIMGWQIGAGVKAHPDYLAYFNECCDEEPARWLVDSDLDWGQDLDRLSQQLRMRKIDHLYLSYFGTADPAKHGLPPYTRLPRRNPVVGWVAVSEWSLAMGHHKWLSTHTPVEHIGKSIRLYHIRATDSHSN